MTLHGWKFRKMEVGEDDGGHVETLVVYQRLIVCLLQLSPESSKLLLHSTKLAKSAIRAPPALSVTAFPPVACRSQSAR
jgi:hypothetical protein